MDDFKYLKKTWSKLGEIDPLWSILSFPEKKGGKWSKEEFYATGEIEINDLFEKIDNLNFPINYGRALDFGCGVGRLTQPLSKRFEETHGADIARLMIELANKFNKNSKKCIYHLNESEDLKIFGDNSFDFIYSNIVLQHMKPKFSKKYIKEFIRIMKPGGLSVFQIPAEFDVNKSSQGQSYINGGLDLASLIKMYRIPKSELIEFIERNKGRIVTICDDLSAGEEWISFRYYVTKDQLTQGRISLFIKYILGKMDKIS